MELESKYQEQIKLCSADIQTNCRPR